MPPALPSPPRRTPSSPTSQVHPGLKVRQSQEARQRHLHMASRAESGRPLKTDGRRTHALLLPPHVTSTMAFQSFQAILCPVFNKDRQMTPKTVGWRCERTPNQNKPFSGAEDSFFFNDKEYCNHLGIILKRPFCNTQDDTVERQMILNKDLYERKIQ